MEDDLHKRVIGQSEAVEAVSKAIRRARAGFKDKKQAGGFVPLSWPDRRRKNGTCQSAGRKYVR